MYSYFVGVADLIIGVAACIAEDAAAWRGGHRGGHVPLGAPVVAQLLRADAHSYVVKAMFVVAVFSLVDQA